MRGWPTAWVQVPGPALLKGRITTPPPGRLLPLQGRLHPPQELHPLRELHPPPGRRAPRPPLPARQALPGEGRRHVNICGNIITSTLSDKVAESSLHELRYKHVNEDVKT
jgi:hypothetical protein